MSFLPGDQRVLKPEILIVKVICRHGNPVLTKEPCPYCKDSIDAR